MDGYDLGAMFYHDVPQAPSYFELAYNEAAEQIKLRWLNPTTTVHGNPLDTLQSIQLWRNDSLIAELSVDNMQDTMEFVDNLNQPDYYRYQICAVDIGGDYGRKLYSNEQWMGGAMEGIVIWELDPTPITGTALKTAIQQLGYPSEKVYFASNSNRYPLESTVDVVFVCLGIYSSNHVLTSDEALRLKNYLDAGGNVYMEGGDTWYFDTQTVVHPYFSINAVADGSADLFNVKGQPGTRYDNMDFVYSGENAWMDHIEPAGTSQRILFNPSTSSGVAIAHDADLYKTIGASFELGGLVDGASPSTKEELLSKIFDFFEITITDIEEDPVNINVPQSFALKQNYPNPFNITTTFQFGLPAAGDVVVNIYAVTGQKIFSKFLGELPAGWHVFQWNGSNRYGASVASGVYFYQLGFKNSDGMRLFKAGKMHLMK